MPFIGTEPAVILDIMHDDAIKESSVALTAGGSTPDTINVNLSLGNVFHVTATQNTTRFNFQNIPTRKAIGFTMRITRNNSNTAFTIDFTNNGAFTIKFADGSDPTIMADGETDIYTFYKDEASDTIFYGALAVNAVA